MKLFQEYYRPTSIDQAFEMMNASSGPASLLAGGTDLLLDIRQGRIPVPHTLVDITSIPELGALELKRDRLFIGAAVPLSKVAESQLVWNNAHVLQEACRLIGGPQVRNVATLGGNVAHALPAADGTIAMMCLDTMVVVASQGDQREIPLHELFIGPGRSTLQEGHEMIVGFSIPLKKPRQASAYMRVMNPQGIALPILNISIWLEREGDILSDIRIAIGPSQDFPSKHSDLDEQLLGKKVDTSIIKGFSRLISEQIPFRTSKHRASADYRHHLVETLMMETFQIAWKRAGEFQEIVDD
ncbi:FAD binding domain-containing protein [Chloroflexota bacterium]